MKLEQINSVDDIKIYIEGCLNDFELGISTKEETTYYIAKLLLYLHEKYANNQSKYKKNNQK